MGAVAAKLARRQRTVIFLNLDELDALLAAAGMPRRPGRDFSSARERVARAADRRRRAVARAAR